MHRLENFIYQYTYIRIPDKNFGFLPEFFQGGKIYCYTNFFCYANFLLFSDQILKGGAKSPRRANCLRGCPLPPVEESQNQFGGNTSHGNTSLYSHDFSPFNFMHQPYCPFAYQRTHNDPSYLRVERLYF